MVLNQRRYKAVVHLAEVLLKPIALAVNEPFKNELPSNIKWPDESFAKENGASIELERTLHISRRPLGAPLQSLDDAFTENNHETAIEVMWSLLADLVITSPKRPPDEGRQIMSTVHQILALIHNLGLIPANIYAHYLPQETTILQQPPILHLLNSRILSTLSDAVWHAYQDEVSTRSKRGENSPWNFFREPPGSRLRSKAQELGPEVWLEFILWCCVEAGFASTGARIIKSLREDVEDPWHAVHWADVRVPSIDLYQVNHREGSFSGQTEAYGGGRHTAESRHRFISAEVVLAIADCLINNLNVEAIDDSLSVHEVQNELRELVSFLESHGIASGYLDYLAVRLLQTECLYDLNKANSLRGWASTIAQLRDLHPVEEQTRHGPGLAFDFVLDRSELRAGILHQALQACTENNLVTKAVDTFTDIQKTVDGNKLQAIGEFLSLPLRPQDGFFTSRLGKGQNEFLNSYGQLPTYKLPPFLDLVSSAKLFGLGDWLLYSDDIDGAVLPSSTWRQPSVTAALIRYATAKNDLFLVQRVLAMCKRSDRKMTVNVLRAFAIYYIQSRDWYNATQILMELRKANGGGYSPRIVASLAATILRLEIDPEVMLQEDVGSDLTQALSLLRGLLKGFYDSSPATFRSDQKKTFRHQVGYLLRLLENVPDSKLAVIGGKFKSMFPVSNEPYLARDTFNILYAAITETRGVLEGRNIWFLFCKDPRDCVTLTRGESCDDEIMIDEHAKDEEDFLQPQTDKPTDGEIIVPAKYDENLSSSGVELEHIGSGKVLETSAEPSPDENAPVPPAYPASLNIELELPQDEPGFASNQSVKTSDVGSEHVDIPIETADVDSDEGLPELNPIVVPDVRTLQILMKGALNEIKARRERKRAHADLVALIRWAEKFYAAFNLTPEDIKTEFHVSTSLPKKLSIATKHRRISRQAISVTSAREKSRPDVGSQFTQGAFSTRLPGVPRPKEQAIQIDGESQVAGGSHDGKEKDTGTLQDGGNEHEPPDFAQVQSPEVWDLG